MGWSKKYKKSIDCNNPKGFSQKAHCAGRKKQESKMSSKLEELVGKPITEEEIQTGQYRSFSDELGENSNTETFVSLKVVINNWRWAGVPFYIRTGKKIIY